MSCPPDPLPPSQTCPKDWPTLKVAQNTVSELELQLVDNAGNPRSDLDDLVTPPSGDVIVPDAGDDPLVIVFADGGIKTIRLWMKQYAADPQVVSIEADYVGDGRFRFNFSSQNTSVPGVFLGTILINDDAGELLFAQNCYVEVEYNVTDGANAERPLSISEVRLAIRDNCPDNNTLLDDYEFTDREIFSCIHKPIDEWNSTDPLVNRYTYSSFPYRYQWLNATIAELLRLAAYHHDRNHLTYNAAGVSVDDKNKAPSYRTYAKELRAEWMTWMKNRKIADNIEAAYGSVRGYWTA